MKYEIVNIDRSSSRGDILLTVLVFAAIAITVIIGLVNWGATLLRSVQNMAQREQALQIAEAGVDYYRWHLAHAPADFKDGTNQAGPYIHQVMDKDRNIIGSYSLVITAPTVGSTLMTLISRGTVASTTITRSIKVVMAIPSFARFAVIADDNMRFGGGTITYGLIQSNGGIRFDGVAHGLVASANSTYTDLDDGSTDLGVYTTVNPSETNNISLPFSNRPDVFMAGRQLSVPAVDFSALSANFASLKTTAQGDSTYWSSSGSKGYHVVLKTNDTFDLYKVKILMTVPSSCSESSVRWGMWSIQTPLTDSSNQSLIGNYAIPAHGVLFFEDNVWVDGQVDSARVTIASAKIGETDSTKFTNIIVNSDLKYTNHDGLDAIGLIAQGDINAGYDSTNTLNIDSALVAQNGRVGRFHYSSNCGTSYKRTTINLFGMIATNVRYGFAYTDDTGYASRNITYDANMLYGPPPSFPLTSSFYTTLSWQEI